MENVKVSVIVPVYNVETYLEEALMSLKNQTLKEIEFLIINDGSTDNSQKIIEEIAQDDPRFRVFNVKNGGIGKAFNLGVSEAKGEYIAEFESDDYVALHAYERLYNTAKSHHADVVRCNWVEFSSEEEVERDILWQHPDKYNQLIDLKTTDLIVQVYPWNAIYKKSMIEKENVTWDEEIKSYGDTGLFWKINSASQNVIFIKDCLYFYRQDNPNSTVNNVATKVPFLFQQFKLIRSNLIEQNKFERYKGYFYKQMFEKYFWAIEKLTHLRDESVYEVIQKVAVDFRQALETDQLNDIDFEYIKQFYQIVNDPAAYYEDYLKNLYKVSVVMPIHNASKYLRQTLETVCEQSLREIEIILVENGSTDNTMDIINEFAVKDPRITGISIGKSNPGHARNVGISMARGRYLQFLDADDHFEANLLQDAYYRAYDSATDILLFGMKEKLPNGEVHVVHNPLLTNGGRMSGEEISLDEVTPYLYDKLFLLEYIKENNLVNLEQFVGEDAYFTYTALLGTEKIVALNKYLLTRIVRQDGLMSTYGMNYRDEFNLHDKMLEYLKQHAPNRIEAYRLKIINTLNWFIFDMNRVDQAFKERFYQELKEKYIQQLGLDLVKKEKYSNDPEQVERITRIQNILQYNLEIYQNIYKDFGMKKTFIIPNVHIQERGGKVIFGQEKAQGNGTAIEMFSIIIADNDTSNASGVIDFVYMGDNTKIIHDSLLVSLLIKKEGTTLKSIVLQAEWEKGYTLLQENMYYTFVDNVFTIWAGYTQKYAAFDYNVRILTSREGETHFSVVRQNQGYIQDTMTSIGNELTPINKIEGNEPTTIKKAVSKSLKKAKGLLK